MFQDHDFGSLSGGRIVRIATHPDYQGMGYGSRALEILQQYYEGKIPNLSETESQPVQEAPSVESDSVSLLEERITPRKNLPPLLLKLSERPPEKLDYLGVSFGLTANLLKFWKRSGYVPVYLRQTANDLTGEHSCIMLKIMDEEDEDAGKDEAGQGATGKDEAGQGATGKAGKEESWLMAYWKDFRRRFGALLSYQFRTFTPSLALNLLQHRHYHTALQAMSKKELDTYFTKYDLKRLELYSQNMVDYHLIMDLLPTISRLHFLHHIDVHLSAAQSAILLGLGLQHKNVEQLEKEIDLPASQILGLFNRSIRKVVQYFSQIQECAVEQEMMARREINMQPVKQTMDDELSEAAKEVSEKQKKDLDVLKGLDLSQFSIRGSEEDWDHALSSGKPAGLVSVKSNLKKKRTPEVDLDKLVEGGDGDGKKRRSFKKHKHSKR
ncbi:RNA cytidine acetyltransferase [Lamellibrachia satsuma]|nr:RNA cytidine acetyltransferase [Lamellibrachia satsuma]